MKSNLTPAQLTEVSNLVRRVIRDCYKGSITIYWKGTSVNYEVKQSGKLLDKDPEIVYIEK